MYLFTYTYISFVSVILYARVVYSYNIYTMNCAPAVLNMYEGLTLQMLVECYTPSTASLLRVNEEPFELFLKLLGCASLSATNTTPPQDLALKQVCVCMGEEYVCGGGMCECVNWCTCELGFLEDFAAWLVRIKHCISLYCWHWAFPCNPIDALDHFMLQYSNNKKAICMHMYVYSIIYQTIIRYRN